MLGRAIAALALMGVILFGPGARSSETCGVQTLCGVAGGEYRVSVPARWDGRSPMPLALFFHGYLGSAADQMADEGFRRAFSEAGILLVFPDGGSARDWVHIGEAAPRDDVAFTRAVLVDVRRRWPIAEPLVWVAGFSSGAFMVWKLACESGIDVIGYVALSGAFVEPIPGSCPAGPVNLLHFHGLVDDMVPIEGRVVSRFKQGDGREAGPFTQSDIFASFAALREVDECRRDADHYETNGSLILRYWDASCRSGRRLGMALHPGGHEMPQNWFDVAWDWIRSLRR